MTTPSASPPAQAASASPEWLVRSLVVCTTTKGWKGWWRDGGGGIIAEHRAYGYDGAKKLNGQKRHLLVGTKGLLLRVLVHAADLRDVDTAPWLLAAYETCERLQHIWGFCELSRHLGFPGLHLETPRAERKMTMTGPCCESPAIGERSDRTALGDRRFRYCHCRGVFHERAGTLFHRLPSPTAVVCLVALWRCRDHLSWWDWATMFLHRGLVFTHVVMRDGERTLAPWRSETRR